MSMQTQTLHKCLGLHFAKEPLENLPLWGSSRLDKATLSMLLKSHNSLIAALVKTNHHVVDVTKQLKTLLIIVTQDVVKLQLFIREN